MSISVAEVLDKAADLIEPEGAWTQWAEARDKNGTPVWPGDPEAKCFCAIGAFSRVLGLAEDEVASHRADFEPIRMAFEKVAGERPMGFNDTHGRKQSEVVAKLREAAALARSKDSGREV